MHPRTAFWLVVAFCVSVIGIESVVGCGSVRDHAQTSPSPGEREVFTVTVDYDEPLDRAIADGRYDFATAALTEGGFSSPKLSGTYKVDYELLSFDRMMATEDLLDLIRARGLEPATLYDLLAVGAANPELQRITALVALGWVVTSTDGHYGIAVLRGYSQQRMADIVWCNETWSGHLWDGGMSDGHPWRFLAVRRTKISK